MDDSLIKLSDLNQLRSSPILNEIQKNTLLKELCQEMDKPEWFTLGVMATSSDIAITVIRQIEKFFNWSPMKLIENPSTNGPVFLKANQSSSEIRIRTEQGLGEGILISGHYLDPLKPANTWGPFPLDFFNPK